MDTIAMNDQRFDFTTKCEKWGELEYDHDADCKTVFFYPKALDSICKEGGFSKKAFLSWGMKNKLVIAKDKYGNTVKRDSVTKKSRKFCCIRMVDDLGEYLEKQKNEFNQANNDGLVFE